MQHYKVQSASEVPRHVFKNLLTLWLAIICLTFAAALLISAGSAKADVILPLPAPEMAYQPAILKVFSSSPTSALIQERCQSHRHPHTTAITYSSFSSRDQRNAETKSLQTIMAIKAYRNCVSQIALEQLTSQ